MRHAVRHFDLHVVFLCGLRSRNQLTHFRSRFLILVLPVLLLFVAAVRCCSRLCYCLLLMAAMAEIGSRHHRA